MRHALNQFLSQKRIAGGAFVLAATQLGASLCGFLRDRSFAMVFPFESDPIGIASVYIAAFRPSDVLFQIIVMSSLSVVLVPFLASHLAHGRHREMNAVTSSVLIVFGTLFTIVALIMAIFFPWIAPYMVKFTGESLALYISFGRLALLTNALFVVGNTAGQYLIAKQQYWIYGITPILWSLGTIGGIHVLSPIIGPLGPMVGTICGTVIYVVIRCVGIYRIGFRFTLASNGWIHGDIGQMGWLILPRMVALGGLQMQLLLFDRLASGLEKGAVAINQFASNVESVIPGIVGIALAQSTFSLLSQAHATSERSRFRHTLLRAMRYNLLLTLPGAAAVMLLPQVAAWLLHLDPQSGETFMQSLVIYAVAIPFESANHLLLRSFYALKNTAIPACSSICSAIVGVSVAYVSIGTVGIFSLAMGYVALQISQTILLGALLTLRMRRA